MAQATTASELRRLGAGGSQDRLSFELVVRILWRCVPLLLPVRWHVAAFAAAVVALFVSLVGLGALGFDLYWTRVLQGEPLVPLQARILGLDPAVVSAGETLSREVRRQVFLRQSLVTIPVLLGTTALAAALFYYSVWIRQRINQTLRAQLYERLQALSLRFHNEHRVGDAVYRLFQDSAMVTMLIEALFLTPAFMVTRFFVMVAVLWAFDPRLGLLLLVSWPPLLLLGYWVSRGLRVRFRQAREAASDLTSRIQEIVTGIRVIKAYGFEAIEQERFERDSRRAFDAAYRARDLFAVFSVALFWTVCLLMAIGAGWAAWATREESPLFAAGLAALAGFSVWTLGLFNVAKGAFGFGTLSQRALFRTWARVQDIAIGLDRVFEMLDLEPEVRDRPDARPLEGVREGVRFRGVRFGYDAARPVVSGIDLDAPRGTTTAVVGPTGSGKTTLMALLLRLFDPQEGRVEIDGVDLRDLRLHDLREQVAIALQEQLLFGATVRENVRYAVPDADDARVREAARIACADGFVEALPRGYDTPLGEGGAKLSTGQRQRLSVARAVLKDTPILVLDEPTASLDAETELHLLRNLHEWGRDRVIFLITHRLSTIRRADRIAVLGEGRLLEVGSHHELMARPDGAYRHLVQAEGSAGAGRLGVAP